MQRFLALRGAKPALVVTMLLVLLIAGLAVFNGEGRDAAVLRSDVVHAQTQLAYVGSETCAGCHSAEATLWQGSQHHHAMAHASEATVLGNFNNASIMYFGVRTRFFRQDGKFWVETTGADGRLSHFQVQYTFGLEPLQQYLVAFPDGRVQALPFAWDSRSLAQGGQRWFHIYEGQRIDHDDPLFWTGRHQNWNFMCAECHSTGVRKNYDPEKDSYATTWSEIDVGCEACHGQGSRHVVWAQAQQSGKSDQTDVTKGLLVQFDERKAVVWGLDAGTGKPLRSRAPEKLRKEVETCGRCHARAGKISEHWLPGQTLADSHLATFLSADVFQADGQMRAGEEVYNYAPFLQSRMFAAGVSCSDCHNPHSAKLKFPGEGVCLQCHAPRYATVAHHHHTDAKVRPDCIDCHMPTSVYMGIDKRHDHSFRIPDPKQSEALGTSNTCNSCHRDKSSRWAALTLSQWFGSASAGFQSWGAAFHAAAKQKPDAARLLTALANDAAAPAYVRGSAMAALAPYLTGADWALARKGLTDPEADIRRGAVEMLRDAPVEQLWPLLRPMLSDPVLGVRIAAVSLLANVDRTQLTATDRIRFDQVVEEFIAAQMLNADRPEARTGLGGFYAKAGRLDEAQVQLQAALRLDPAFSPALVNLADLYRQLGRDHEAEILLRDAIRRSPRDAGLHAALGLGLVRLNRLAEAVVELHRATALAPDDAHHAYVYAVALDALGRRSETIALLKKNLMRHPADHATLSALISFSQEQGEMTQALEYARRLARLVPEDQQVADLVQQLQLSAGKALKH